MARDDERNPSNLQKAHTLWQSRCTLNESKIFHQTANQEPLILTKGKYFHQTAKTKRPSYFPLIIWLNIPNCYLNNKDKQNNDSILNIKRSFLNQQIIGYLNFRTTLSNEAMSHYRPIHRWSISTFLELNQSFPSLHHAVQSVVFNQPSKTNIVCACLSDHPLCDTSLLPNAAQFYSPLCCTFKTHSTS